MAPRRVHSLRTRHFVYECWHPGQPEAVRARAEEDLSHAPAQGAVSAERDRGGTRSATSRSRATGVAFASHATGLVLRGAAATAESDHRNGGRPAVLQHLGESRAEGRGHQDEFHPVEREEGGGFGCSCLGRLESHELIIKYYYILLNIIKYY